MAEADQGPKNPPNPDELNATPAGAVTQNMSEEPSSKGPGPGRRSIALWGTGMLLALCLTWVVAAIVVPAWQTVPVVERHSTIPYVNHFLGVHELGGAKAAAKKLTLYLRLPQGIAPHRPTALLMLGNCGKWAAPTAREYLGHPDPELRVAALSALVSIEDPGARDYCRDALHDEDFRVRFLATYKLRKWKDLQSLPRFIQLLKDPRVEVRGQAAEALGELRDHRAYGPLMAAMQDDKFGSRSVAAHALICLGQHPDPKPFLKYVDDPDPYMRQLVAAALGQTKLPAVTDTIIKMLDDPNKDVQISAIWALMQFRSGKTVAALEKTVQRDNPEIIEAAARALAEINKRRSVPALIAALRKCEYDSSSAYDQSPTREVLVTLWKVRDPKDITVYIEILKKAPLPDDYIDHAIKKLGVIGTPAVEPLMRLLENQEHEWQAAYALAEVGAPAVRSLIKIVRTREGRIRDRAFLSLTHIGKPAAPALVALLGHKDEKVFWATASALDDMGEPALDSLHAALRDPRPRVRAKAASVLGCIGSAKSAGALIKALADKDAKVRAEVANSLGYTRNPHAVGPLVKALSDPVAKVRAQAAFGLGTLNDSRKADNLARFKVVEKLKAALSDDDLDVRKWANWSLEIIQAPEAASPQRKRTDIFRTQ
jgi:HEAT repeat protein